MVLLNDQRLKAGGLGCVTVLGILSKDRLLTGCPLGRAQNRARLFAVTYRAATVRERSRERFSPRSVRPPLLCVTAPRHRMMKRMADREAAVAIVRARSPEESILLIRRTQRVGDPSSGHWSLLGGRRDLQD